MRKNFRLLLIGFIALVVMSAFAIRFQPAAAQEETDQKQIAAPQANFTVNSTADPGTGVCDAAECTLREAITAANSSAGLDQIFFAIPGTGPFTIQPAAPLPNITEAVIINGYTQPGSASISSCTGVATLQIIINGANAGAGSNGLTLASSDNFILGLVINGFDGNGIEIDGSNNGIVGNFIGTNGGGSGGVPNNTNGINITSGSNNSIGSGGVNSRNVISGNLGRGVSISGGSSGNFIQGNYIGTDATGTADLGNGSDGIDIFQSFGNTIGGSTATLGCLSGNVISGNNEDGIGISGTSATGNIVQGNLIGTNAAGTADLGNSSSGINIFASGNGIGGATATTRNIISGNDGGGVVIGGGMNNAVQGNYIGTNLAGTAALRNPDGVRIDGGASDNQIGSGASDSLFYANSGTNFLIRFNEAGTVIPIGAITGLQAGEEILGMDFRPLNGQLYGLGANTSAGTGRLYTINKTTAVATQVGTGTFPLSGTQFGFDFNPTVDRIRVVTNTGQNLRINPNNAVVTVDGNINGATTQADAAAYTNNFAGATSTTLYDIDLVTDALYIQSNPNGGTTTLVGSLGGSFVSLSGFDIRASDNTAFAALIPASTSNLYSINLSTGQATFLADLGGRALRAMTIEVANAGQANVISGNDVGVHIAGGNNNSVRGNLIGTGADGTSDIGNTEAGVYIHEPKAVGNQIGGAGEGDGNTIRFNGDGTLNPALQGEGGIVIYFGATGNPILRNSITANTGLGIDLDSSVTPAIGADGVTPNDPNDVDSGDANNLQNYPVLLMASTNTQTTITGTLNSTPSRMFRIEIFSDTAADPSGNGEGRTFVGAQNVMTNASGNAVINFTTTTPVQNGNVVTATATDLTTSDTSEFSMPVTAAGGGMGIEGDVAPRMTGDGMVRSDDVVQIRRFLNGTDTPSTTPNEFQRADSDPFSSRGDGMLNSADVVQTRRYQNGTSPLQSAGGPTMPNASALPIKVNKTRVELQSPEGNLREVRVESASGDTGQTVTVNIRVNAAGEAEYGFVLNYDQGVLSNPVIGGGDAGALVRSCNIATAGQINCSIGGFSKNQVGSSDAGIGEIKAGDNQILVTVTFTIAAKAQPGTTSLTLSNVNASNDAAQLFTPTATGGTVTIRHRRQRMY